MRPSNPGMLLAAGLLVSVLVGCAPSTPVSSPSPSPSATSTPSPAPSTPAPPALDPADLATWVISDGGIGPVQIGGDFAATLAGLPDTWTNDTANCSWSAWWKADDSAFGAFFVRGTETETAPVREISIYTAAEMPTAVPGPTTAEGLGIGATKDQVLAAYPGAEVGTAQIGESTWIKVPGDEAAHVFFSFRADSDVASDVVVTTGSEPSYEVCG